MSLKGEVKIAVHLERFRNIELFKQGLYQLRFRLYYTLDSETFYANPTEVWRLNKSSKNWPKKDSSSIVSAYIDDEIHAYNTRTFLIRYQEENFLLNELCVFVCLVPIKTNIALTIEAELLYSNLEKNHKKRESDELRVLDTNPIMKQVVAKTYIVSNLWNPMQQYLPISFDPTHFCSIDAIIHVLPFSYDIGHNGVIKIQNEYFDQLDKIDKIEKKTADLAYYSLLDPLRISYNTIRVLALLIQNSNQVNSEEVQKLIPRELKNPSFNTEDLQVSFYELIKTDDPGEISQRIIEEIQILSYEIKKSFAKLIQLIEISNTAAIDNLKGFFEQKISKHFQEYIIIENKIPNIYRNHREYAQKAEEIRRSPYYENLERLEIHSDDLYNENGYHPIFFLENYNIVGANLMQSQPPSLKVDSQDLTVCKINDIHVFVLVHGYKGCSADMHLIKGYINQIYPDIHILSSKINEFQSDSLIGLQGYNLASEIIQYISINRIPLHRLKLSFLGHSLGGLIVRSSLPHLTRLRDNLYSFITLSSPHLGIGISGNPLFELGKWFLKNFQTSDSFSQMTFQDSANIKDSYIYELSQHPGLEWFENIVLFSCRDDPYVNEESARIQMNSHMKYSTGYEEMINNIWGKINMERTTRIDVHFKHEDFKQCICCGNRHIDFIDNSCFIKMICYSFPILFT